MEKVRKYSGLFIIVPEKEEAIDEVKNGINSVIGENSGKVVKENMMGKRKLAYPIKKKETAVYYEVTFDSIPSGVAKMMKQFRINTDIMRTLIDKVE